MTRSQLERSIRACTSCSLHETCKSPVPFRGFTPARIMIIGEAPGADEDAQGKPFVGSSGKLLMQIWKDIGLDQHAGAVAIANVVCCRPPSNRTPTPDEVAACSNNLEMQISLCQPDFLLLLGRTAINRFKPGVGVWASHGKPFRPLGRPICFPTFHPAAAMRSKDYRHELELDLAVFRALLLSPDPMRDPAWEIHG